MLPWVLLDSAPIPGNPTPLNLFRRGTDFSIRIGGAELMSSREHGSEDALGEVACERLAGRRGVRVLVGGLGLGFTLAAVLRHCAGLSEVVVAELIPAVVSWNRGPLAHLAGEPLNDRRVTIREADVAHVMREEKNGFDAILLDVDNGPAAMTQKENQWLYTERGLRAAAAALRPGGLLAIWSAGPSTGFTKRLERVGYAAEEIRTRGRAKSGARYTIWIARTGERSGPPRRQPRQRSR